VLRVNRAATAAGNGDERGLASSEADLLARLRFASCARETPAEVAAFVDHFRARHGDSVAAIVFYGSRLSAGSHAATSLYDFFVFTDDYGAFFANERRVDRALARVLPPSTYYVKVGEARAKYNVVSLADFEHDASPRTRDLFLAGRLSKRVHIVYTRDDGVTEALLTGLLAAMQLVVPLAVARLPGEFSFEEYLRAVLALSYAAEIRVESDEKVGKLLDAHRDFYTFMYGGLLESLEREGLVVRGGEDDRWHQEISTLAQRQKRAARLLASSRRRMYARWFKYMATLDGWVDLMLEKVERTKGIKIELSPLERKYAFIFGWKYFLRMLRKGMVK
jgi:hypothetical protein